MKRHDSYNKCEKYPEDGAVHVDRLQKVRFLNGYKKRSLGNDYEGEETSGYHKKD